jgi:hypothetical protein
VDAVNRRNRLAPAGSESLDQLRVAGSLPASEQVISQAQEHRLAAGKFPALVYRVTIPFLLPLHGKSQPVQDGTHLLCLFHQGGILGNMA